MIALNERIRLALLKEWVQSLYALRNLENVNARHRVLTPDEEAELSATAGHYTWIAQRYGKLRERLAEERAEAAKEASFNPQHVAFSYYYQCDIAERFRWCPPLRWWLMRDAARRLERVCSRMAREGWQ
ncbi:hypothetical protein [Bilophila wadsworthia]|jgi:hypothetical protein|uniref:hypothetical protein n=1 Tax=Bilophila wadsworthia TaxID=35833 RepID=UPI0027B9E8DE|nr:hypothetical protein [Bilophila wadsworthia]MDU4377103.1 hypothetical protein [Bilophila wadsworthia]